MGEYRVDELARAAGVSVEALRSYQSKGLLPAPRHRGRVAVYGERHLERLRVIRELKGKGHSLRAIASMLHDDDARERRARPADAVLDSEEESFGLLELAERTRVPPALLRSLEGSGVLRPLRAGGERRYTPADVRAVRMLLGLVSRGVPMEEFLQLARVQLEAADTLAHGAVELFLRYVREPLLAADVPPEEEAVRLVAAFRGMLEAAGELMTYTFQRTVLGLLQEKLEQRGTTAELAAIGGLTAASVRPA